MQKIQFLKLSAISVLFSFVVGCAGTSVRDTREIAYSGQPRPTQVLIYNFAASPEDIQQNSSIFAKIQGQLANTNQTAEEIKLGREVADAMATELTQKIAALGLNPIRADQNLRVSPGAILITGQFTNINEGNRLRRNVIGLGMGQSSLDSKVRVLAPSASGYQELISFDTHADSGEMPGAAVMGPAGAAAGAGTAAVIGANAAVGGVKSYKSASAQQAKTMAEKIADELARYFAQQGWINPDLVR
ncbi:MAG: DUF4410 domain-containing protein [Methylococcaceae bacterium]|nr:DUF4410 domain-containing protein [Methylococcaceae bacterium]MDP3904168.1 DUF4410 domain-containing protein [Methylococcaceae bacterium]